MDPETFFPGKTELATKGNTAITTCFGCRVREECGKYQKSSGSHYGIWAARFAKKD